MAEYMTKDAVISLFEKWSDGYAYIEIPVQDAIRQVSAIPPANVRPVVLCDKCRWFDDIGYPNPDPEMPELRMGYCSILGRDVQACWFCGAGEQKEDADG